MGHRTARNAVAASVQMAVTTGSGLLYFGFLMRSLGPERLGGWLAWLALAMMACLADLGLRDALVRDVALAEGAGERRRVAALLDTTLWTVAVAVALALALLMGVLPHGVDLGAAASHADWRLVLGVALMVWLQRLADVHAAVLEGLQCYGDVARNNVVGACAGLVAVVLLVPPLGVEAASLGLSLQYALSGLCHLVTVRRHLPDRPWWPGRWHAGLCRASLGYGLAVQGQVGAFLLIESGIKLALSQAGSLALVAFFDLAFRIGRGLRNLLVAGNRVLVPRLAVSASSAREDADDAVDALYRSSAQWLLLFSLAGFTVACALCGVVSLLTRGEVDPVLLRVFLPTLLAWYLFAMADPVINVAMGDGRMGRVLVGHFAMLALLVAGALVLRWAWPWQPGQGEAAGLRIVDLGALAIGLPSIWLLLQFHRARRLPVDGRAAFRILLAHLLCAAAVACALVAPGPAWARALGAAALALPGLWLLPARPWALALVQRQRARLTGPASPRSE